MDESKSNLYENEKNIKIQIEDKNNNINENLNDNIFNKNYSNMNKIKRMI